MLFDLINKIGALTLIYLCFNATNFNYNV